MAWEAIFDDISNHIGLDATLFCTDLGLAGVAAVNVLFQRGRAAVFFFRMNRLSLELIGR